MKNNDMKGIPGLVFQTMIFLSLFLLDSLPVYAQQQTALPSDGSFSREHAPQGAFRYQRQFYLIKPGEMAASGIPSGTELNAIGFTIGAAQDTTTKGAFKVYLENTSDMIARTDMTWTEIMVNSNSLLIEDPVPGNYEWQVKANCDASSPFTSSASFSNANLDGCNRPVNLTTSAVTDDGATLSWYAPGTPEFSGFEVQYTALDVINWVIDTVTESTYILTGLDPNKSYQWKVQMVCSGDNSEVSASSFTTLNENLCNPTSNQASMATSDTSAVLDWDPAAGATRYDVRFRRVGTQGWVTTISFVDSLKLMFGLVSGTTYEWQVRTVCGATSKGAWLTGPDFTTTGTPVCYQPTGLFTNQISDTTANLNWTASVGATSYTVRYRLKNSISWVNATTPMTLVHNDSILIPDTIGAFEIPFQNGDDVFTYSGGGVYVAFEYNRDTGAISSLNNALATGEGSYIPDQFGQDSLFVVLSLYGTENADTSLPLVLLATDLRPETRFGSGALVDSVGVEAIYALGSYALNYADTTPVMALISNYADEERTYTVEFSVIEESTGTVRFTAAQDVTINADTTAMVSFNEWVPELEETDSLIISVPAPSGENVTSNNRAVYMQTVNSSLLAYDDGSGQVSSAGFGVDSGLILVRHKVNGCAKVNAVRVHLDASAAGHELYAVLLDASGTIIDSSNTFTPTNEDVNTYRAFYFPGTPDVTDSEFYVGIAQQASPGNPYFPVGVQWETDRIRTGAYYRDSIGGTMLADMPSPGRLMMRAEIIPASPVPVIEGDFSVCMSESNELSVASATVRYANAVLSYSSQFANVNYSANRALGAPDVFPEDGADPKAWVSATTDDQREFIELNFPDAGPINYISIFETLNPGAVDSVYVKNPGTDLYELVYGVEAVAVDDSARALQITFPVTGFDVSELRIELASDSIEGFNSIDAVAIGQLTSPASYATYDWSPNGETTATIMASSAGTYTVEVTDANGCESSASATVITPSMIVPDITIAVGDMPIFCMGDSAVLISSQPTGNVWSTGAMTPSITVYASGSYTVSYDDGTGCGLSISAPFDITVNPLPEPAISGSLGICPGGSTTLDAGDGYTGYTWSDGSPTQTITVTQADLYLVSVTDDNGCQASASATTYISEPPTPSINGDIVFCPGASTDLDAGPGFAQYSWSTGATSQEINVSTATTVSVTVTDDSGCTGQASISTTLFPQPTPSIAGDPDFCPGESTTLDAGSGYSNYAWSTGASSQTISVGTAGLVDVTVTDGNGCMGESSVDVTQNIPPTPVITGSFSFCGGSTTILDAGPGYASYLWSSGQVSQKISVDAPGTYTVTVTDVNGCTGTASAATTIDGSIPDSPGPITGPSDGLCNATNVVYSIDPVPNATLYVWTVPAGVTIIAGQGTTNLTVSFGAGFTGGTIVVAASNPCGQSPSIDPTFIMVDGTPAAPGPVSGPVSGVCNEADVMYSIDPVFGASSYLWQVPEGATITSGQGTNSVMVTLGGNSGDVCVRTINSCGFSDPSCLFVSLPAYAVDAGDCNFVFPGIRPLDCVELTAVVSGGAPPFTFEWTDLMGNIVGNTQTVEVCPTVNTSYIVAVTDANGCTIIDKVEVEIVDATCKGNKVLVCHVVTGKTLCLSPGAAQSHLDHGDYLGSCDASLPCAQGGSAFAALINGEILQSLDIGFSPGQDDEDLFLFPNPAGTSVTLAFREILEQPVRIEFMDALQRIVQVRDIDPGSQTRFTFDLTEMPEGMYFLRVQTPDSKTVKQLVISRND